MHSFMHDLLALRGAFHSAPIKPNGQRLRPLPKGQSLSSEHLNNLAKELTSIRNYWSKHSAIGGALVSVHYRQVIAKSNRIQILLKDGAILPNESIRGSHFERDKQGHIRNHVFTHFISLNAIDTTIACLKDAANYISTYCFGIITEKKTNEIIRNGLSSSSLKKTTFMKVVLDAYYVSSFQLDSFPNIPQKQSIVTIYRTGKETKKLLAHYGISIDASRMIGDYTLLLDPIQIQQLQERAPYLISMSVADMKKISPETSLEKEPSPMEIPDFPYPSNEPTIGVIDTQFNKDVYFYKWVDYKNMLDSSIPLHPNDFIHGTAVTSIIVDGPRGNPKLEDHCGLFKVRHFGVSTATGFSSFQILRLIRNIVAANSDIKVWNLSLGSDEESNPDFISPEAAELDRIQNDYDVIFVVAGTNKSYSHPSDCRIGAPADSLNSLVVNAVTFDGKPASYTRNGPVLSFFHKPDLCYYGGDGITYDKQMAVCCDNTGCTFKCGTSFAAPWIARKLSFLIDIMGFTKEIAKALLIDSAADWKSDKQISDKMGYGIVPIDIHDILQTKNDEIRFYISGTTRDYETYNYNLPLPQTDKGYPFFARATLVYFPTCQREQGVDYTGTELDLHFGRVKKAEGKVEIQDIKGNEQANIGIHSIYEKEARDQYRKWDNIKHLSDTIKTRSKPRKVYEDAQWGIRIVTKERNYIKKKTPMSFGLVVTLKEMDGKDRYNDFIKLCSYHGWMVTQANINSQLDIHQKSEAEVILED